MIKKILTAALCLVLLASCAMAEVNADFAKYDVYGTVLSAAEQDGSVVIEAEGYYGYHMDEDPSMTVSVTIAEGSVITAASVIGAKAQTPGFDAMITQEYMDAAYVGKIADPLMESDVVSGATATCQAVRYAVQTAAYYAQNALGYAADTSAADKAELNAVYPASYETIVTDYAPDAKKVGSVLYAAEGVAADGTQVVAMKVKGGTKLAQGGSARHGWTAGTPNAFTMIIVVDKATHQVCAWDILVDGTKEKTYFVVPDEKIDAYKTVAITEETVFDEFLDGSVMSIDVELGESADGPIITGTSIVYTGKTKAGTFSSQMLRNCFRTAAALYCNYQK
ncbi:MAG: FMN-binding protein [Clostridia bacterium]|nr:FMN-binding protein [Clostridia bacterium]